MGFLLPALAKFICHNQTYHIIIPVFTDHNLHFINTQPTLLYRKLLITDYGGDQPAKTWQPHSR